MSDVISHSLAVSNNVKRTVGALALPGSHLQPLSPHLPLGLHLVPPLKLLLSKVYFFSNRNKCHQNIVCISVATVQRTQPINLELLYFIIGEQGYLEYECSHDAVAHHEGEQTNVGE